jgi:hypothetical protein
MGNPLDDITSETNATNGIASDSSNDASIIAPKKRRGRPPGSTNKPKETAPAIDVTEEAVRTAWQGLFSVISFVVWLFGGKVKPGQVGELTNEESENDARQLLPIAQRFPSVVKILGWIGAPLVAAKRIKQKFEFPAKGSAPKRETPPANVTPIDARGMTI